MSDTQPRFPPCSTRRWNTFPSLWLSQPSPLFMLFSSFFAAFTDRQQSGGGQAAGEGVFFFVLFFFLTQRAAKWLSEPRATAMLQVWRIQRISRLLPFRPNPPHTPPTTPAVPLPSYEHQTSRFLPGACSSLARLESWPHLWSGRPYHF